MLKKVLPLCLVFSASVQAAVVTQTIDFSTSSIINSGTDIRYSVSDDLFNASFYDINQFDPTLGTLTQIGITISGDLSFSARGTYRDNNSFSDTAGSQSTSNLGWAIFDPFLSFYSIDVSLPTLSNSCEDTSGFGDAICTTAIQTPPQDLSFGYNFDSAGFDSAIGTGTVSFGVRQNGTLTTQEYEREDGFVDYRYANYRSDGTLTVEYYYDVAAVPVPSAVWLFSSALVGLAGIKRKKRF